MPSAADASNVVKLTQTRDNHPKGAYLRETGQEDVLINGSITNFILHMPECCAIISLMSTEIAHGA
jgi:hypothetical protein